MLAALRRSQPPGSVTSMARRGNPLARPPKFPKRHIRNEYLPQQEARTKLDDIKVRLSWGYFVRRRRRLTQYLLSPREDALLAVKLREARIGHVTSEMME